MSKPLVFVQTKVKVDANPEDFDSWELLAFGDCPIMHAAYNPVKQALVCQFSSVKENFVDYPTQGKNGKVSMQERRAEQYYRQVVTDKEAIQYILDNYVGNYDGQEWDYKIDELELSDTIKTNL